MIDNTTFKRYAIIGQLGFVLIFLLINYIENVDYYPNGEALVYALNYTFMIGAVAYLHYFFILPIYLKGRLWLYLLLFLLTMTSFIALYYIVDYLLPFEYNYDDEDTLLTFDAIVYDYLLLILTSAYSSLYYFVEQWMKNTTTHSELRNEKLQAELNFLKSQINPHFLFNTLNNIYSYVQTGNEKSGPMLEHLSSILRFMVYDCGENRVELHKEITAIEDLLDILRMKNSAQKHIVFQHHGVKGFHLIAPLILVNIVENACKHSNVIHDSEGFLKVDILVNQDDECQFHISNSFKPKPSKVVENAGLGLMNIKKRLALQYDEHYTMLEEIQDNIYSLKLSLPLERKT